MLGLHRVRKSLQSGFTLIELIVVIVILGILAAVAIPQFSDNTTAARQSVVKATEGALKSAWSAAYAEKKGVPTVTDIAEAMADPVCSPQSNGTITCAGIQNAANTALAIFATGGDSVTASIASPRTIVGP